MSGTPFSGESQEETYEPTIDLVESDDEIKVVAELPGVEKNNIKVTLNRNILTISAKSDYKKYFARIELPVDVDAHSAKATYKNGILSIVLKKIEIKVE